MVSNVNYLPVIHIGNLSSTKHFFQNALILGIVIVSVALGACSSDDSVYESATPPAQKTYTLIVSATKDVDEALTRALSLDGNSLNATWAEGEEVTVYNITKSEDISGSLVAQSSGASTTLRGTLTGTIEEGDKLKLKYLSPDYHLQDGTLTSISNYCDYAEATVTVASVEGGNVTTTGSAAFTNQQAIVKFTLTDGTNILYPSQLSIVVGDYTHYFYLTDVDNYVYRPNGENAVYVAIPGISKEDITLSVYNYDKKYYSYERSNITFTNGKYYTINVKMKEVDGSDLSMVDCAGNVRSTRWTSNCYMVHKKGNYKLPLVYGNAIKNGEVNTVAFNPGTYPTSDHYCANFINHAGNAITGPWITKNGSGINAGMGIAVASAELLWQDAQGLITAVGIDGDYLILTVGKDAKDQQGNALIAVKDGSGNIVWSWHIWVTDECFDYLTTISTGSHDYKVTPINLGGVDNTGNGYCTYYQWGRKDAFIPSAGSGTNSDHAVYDISGNVVTGITSRTDYSAVSIADNIKNPTTFNYINNSTSPYSPRYRNMWNARQKDATTNVSSATIKTIYDPCPPRFCVPTDNLYYFIGKDGENDRLLTTWNERLGGAYWNVNITGESVPFPALGCRWTDASVNEMKESGYYWSATNGDNCGNSLYFWKTPAARYWQFHQQSLAYGYAIRAVTEE